MIGGRVLDPTAILDLASGRSMYGQALIDAALATGVVIAVPAGSLAEAWAMAPASGRPFLHLLADLPIVIFQPLDQPAAEAVGVLAADRGRPLSGVAHAVVVAQQRQWTVVTGDPDAVLALDPRVSFESLP